MAAYFGGASATRKLGYKETYRVVFKPSAVNIFISDFAYGMGRVWEWITAGGHGLGVVPLSGNPTTTGDRRATVDFMVPGNTTRTIADVVRDLNAVSHLVTVESVALLSSSAAAVSPAADAQRQAVTNAASAQPSGSLGESISNAASKLSTVALLALLVAGGYFAWRIYKEART